jgi:hypothetical protein
MRASRHPSCDNEAECSPGHFEIFFVHDLPAVALLPALAEGRNEILLRQQVI